MQATVPDSFLLVQLEFAPYCTTVSAVRLNFWDSSATLIHDASSLLNASASLLAAGSVVDAVVDAFADAAADGTASVL